VIEFPLPTAETAEHLGISQSALRRLCNKLGIEPERIPITDGDDAYYCYYDEHQIEAMRSELEHRSLPPLTPERIDEALAAYQAGHGLRYCATMLRVGVTTMRQMLVDNGVPVRTPCQRREVRGLPPLAPERIDEALAAYQAGHGLRYCATMLHVHVTTMRQMLVDNGVPVRTPCQRREAP
jgi:hypothetical protein